jgi:hypothetical protein
LITAKGSVNGILLFGYPEFCKIEHKSVSYRISPSTYNDFPGEVCELEVELKFKKSEHTLNDSSRKIYDELIQGIVCANNRAILNDETFSDFKFITKEKVFNIHKNILAESSSVFRQMFLNEMEESRSNECKIDDVEAEIFEQMLKFIYCGDVTITSINDLFKIAHLYDVKGLKEICSQRFDADLTKDNALEVYKFASVYDDDLKDLKDEAWKIIKR